MTSVNLVRCRVAPVCSQNKGRAFVLHGEWSVQPLGTTVSQTPQTKPPSAFELSTKVHEVSKPPKHSNANRAAIRLIAGCLPLPFVHIINSPSANQPHLSFQFISPSHHFEVKLAGAGRTDLLVQREFSAHGPLVAGRLVVEAKSGAGYNLSHNQATTNNQQSTINRRVFVLRFFAPS
jgi:hypothetical protein